MKSHYRFGSQHTSRNSIAATLSFATSLFGISTATYATPPTEPTIGVGTHFGQGQKYLPSFSEWIKKGGVLSFRDEMYWKEIESEREALLIQGRALYTQQAASQLSKLGVKQLLVLSYGNPLYDGGSQPSSTEGRRAFGNYASYISNQMRPDYAEIWNEWNIGAGSKPRVKTGTVEDYIRLCSEAYSKIKAASPNTTVLAGALGDDFPDWIWAKSAMSKGLLKNADGLSVHLYNYSASRANGAAEELITRIDRLSQITKDFNKGKTFPLYITEIGWPNHTGMNSVSHEHASRDAAVFLLAAKARPYIRGIWFYEYKDGGKNPFEKEHHFGLVDADGQEKPIACTVRTLSSLLRKATLIESGDLGEGVSRTIYSLTSGEQLVAFWIKPQPENFIKDKLVRIETAATQYSSVELGCPGGTSKHNQAVSDSRIVLSATENPTLLILPKSKKLTIALIK